MRFFAFKEIIKMSQNIDDELSIYLDHLSEELHNLPDNLLSSSPWKELYYLITGENIIDGEIYTLNRRLFREFLEILERYNHSGHEVEILESLQNITSTVLSLLTIYNSESDSIVTKKNKENKVLDNRISRLKEGLSILENEQKNIAKQNELVIASQNEANRIITELKDKNDAYSQLIDEDSNARVLKLYNEIYDREISIADQYRNWALGIFALIGLVLVFGFMNISIQNWNHLRDSGYIHIPLGFESLIKTLMLFSLTTPAWYLTRESSKHRKVAYKAQMLGTELASFPLYVREFKDEDRLELRRQLADRFFGQELFNDSKITSSSDNSLEQIKLLTEANKVLAEALKAKKVVE